jgi:hypothetical protein
MRFPAGQAVTADGLLPHRTPAPDEPGSWHRHHARIDLVLTDDPSPYPSLLVERREWLHQSLTAAGERRRWPIWLLVVSGVCHELRQMSADRPVALVPHSNAGLFIPVIGSGPPTSYAARGGWGR